MHPCAVSCHILLVLGAVQDQGSGGARCRLEGEEEMGMPETNSDMADDSMDLL